MKPLFKKWAASIIVQQATAQQKTKKKKFNPKSSVTLSTLALDESQIIKRKDLCESTKKQRSIRPKLTSEWFDSIAGLEFNVADFKKRLLEEVDADFLDFAEFVPATGVGSKADLANAMGGLYNLAGLLQSAIGFYNLHTKSEELSFANPVDVFKTTVSIKIENLPEIGHLFKDFAGSSRVSCDIPFGIEKKSNITMICTSTDDEKSSFDPPMNFISESTNQKLSLNVRWSPGFRHMVNVTGNLEGREGRSGEFHSYPKKWDDETYPDPTYEFYMSGGSHPTLSLRMT